MARSHRKARRGQASRRAVASRDWPRLIGEATVAVVILLVPWALNPYSKNSMDVKDVTLGLGVSLGFSAYLLACLARGRFEWAASRLTPAVVAFAAWATVTLTYSGFRWSTVSELGRLYAHIGLYWLVVSTIRETSQVRRLLGVAAAGAIPVIVYAFMQATGHDRISWNEPGARVFSLLGNPTYFAGYLVLLIPLLVAVAWPRGEADPSGHEGGRVRVDSMVFYAVVAALLVFCLFLTVSLSPIIGLGLGAFLATVLSLVRSRRRLTGKRVVSVAALALVAVGLFGVSYARLPEAQRKRIRTVLAMQDPYGKERTIIRDVGWQIYREHPVVGTGYGTYRIVSLEALAPRWYSELRKSTDTMLVPNYAHNEFVQVLAGTGLIGGILFGLMLAAAYWTALRVSRRHPGPTWSRIGLAALAGMTAFLFQNSFGVTFRQPGSVTFFWLTLGFLAVADAGLPRHHTAAEAESAQLRIRTRLLRKLPAAGFAVVFAAVVGANLWLSGTLINEARAGMLTKRAEAASKRGDFKEAVYYGERALDLNPYNVHAYYITGYAVGVLGDHEKSLELNGKALALLPGNASVYYNLGVNYKELGRFDEAEQSFARAIELMPTSVRHHAALAELLIAEGELDAALAQATQALELARKDPQVYLLLADIEGRRGQAQQSLSYLRKAAARAEDDADLWRQCAVAASRLGEWKICRGCSQRWLKYDPRSVEAARLLGTCYIKLGDLKAAQSALQAARKLAPQDAMTRLLLAGVYLELGKVSKARAELEAVPKIAPGTKEAATARKLLKTLPRRR